MSAFAGIVQAVTRHRGVVACLIVSADDGIVVEGTAHVGVNTAAFAALTASLHRKATRAAAAAAFGTVQVLDLEAEEGRVIAAGQGGLLVVAVTDARANFGLVRVELLRAAAGL